MPKLTLAARLENLLFGHRPIVIGLFVLATLGFVWSATGLHIDAGFAKQLPLKHPYMATFVKHQQEFGGANRLLVAIVARDGNMFTPGFFEALKGATDEVFFLRGVDRARVQSLFTPNVRYTEVVEDGIAAGNVIPDDFTTTPEGLAAVRRNILKAGIVGRLVANDFSGAIISAELMEFDPTTGQRLDFLAVAKDIETRVREKFDADFVPGSPVDVHIIGFAKVMGDMASGAQRVVMFFLGSFFLTGALVFLYAQSHRLSFLTLTCAVLAVVWQLGVINLLGFGIDPMSILVPFLVFAIAVSHGMQMISSFGSEVFDGADGMTAARNSFRRLLLPGFAALATDVIGFVAILFIEIRVIQEIAIAAGIGVAAIILTNLVLLPVALSYVKFDARYPDRLHRRGRRMEPLWRRFSARGDADPGSRHREPGRGAGRVRGVEGRAGSDRRPPPRRAGTAGGLPLQHRHGRGDVEVLDRRRRAERDCRNEIAGVRRPRGDDDHRRLLVAHGEPAWRPVRRGPVGAREDAERRLERGVAEVARPRQEPVGAHPVGDLRADVERAAERRLQRHARHALHPRPQGRDD